MPKRCVAYGCGYTNKDGMSLFTFPRDVSLKKKWTDQVKRTRETSGLDLHSILSCAAVIFTTDCFEPHSAIAASVGLKNLLD